MFNSNLEEPKPAKIAVMGIGGAGCNAINSMIDSGVKSAEFIAVNTDAQSLNLSKAEINIAIGSTTTKGLGAGARPAVGRSAAEESREEIRAYLDGVNILFITAGMGGGTGTGAAPVIAQMARERNILTVGVVTKPFAFEGKVRAHNAEEGIKNLIENVDTLIVIQNENLLKVLGPNVSFLEAFKHANSILKDAIKGLADLIATPALINLDFADVKTIMQNKGIGHVAVGVAEGEDKIPNAVKQAVMSQLCETNIAGATGVLMAVVGGPDSLGLKEVNDATTLVKGCLSPDANLIFGAGLEESFGDKVQVLLVATGFEDNAQKNKVFGARGVNSSQVPMSNENFMKMFNISDNKQPVQPQQYQQMQAQPINPQQMPFMQPQQQAFNYDDIFSGQANQQPAQPAQPVQPAQPINPQQKRVAPWFNIRQNRNI